MGCACNPREKAAPDVKSTSGAPGRNSYRNLVSCCIECNTRKGDRPAPDFLRTLYRQGRLTPAELDARLCALKDLAAGKLGPSLTTTSYRHGSGYRRCALVR